MNRKFVHIEIDKLTNSIENRIMTGYIREPEGVTLVVDKQDLTKEIENSIKDFISKSKEKNKAFINKLKLKK